MVFMNGIIERIKIYPEKGSAALELDEGLLVEGLGLKGDFHAKGGERQITLLFAEISQNEQGLCLSKFKENISMRFGKPPLVQAGTYLEAGEAVMEITEDTKHCHAECSLVKAGKLCSLAGLNIYAKVVKSGAVRVGDKVCVV